jgi:hypothetical protein
LLFAVNGVKTYSGLLLSSSAQSLTVYLLLLFTAKSRALVLLSLATD